MLRLLRYMTHNLGLSYTYPFLHRTRPERRPQHPTQIPNVIVANERVRHLSSLCKLDTVQARVDYSARCIPQEPASLFRVGDSFYDRFQENGKPVDIETAVAFGKQAVDLTPEGHSNKPVYLNSFGISLMRRFERLGDLVDVDSAIRMQREAVDLTPSGHPNKPMYLNNLGLSFVRRFERSGDLADVDSAIRAQREAVDLIPEGHSKTPMYLSNLGNSFGRRFERLGDLVDVDSAIRMQREAVDLTPSGHSNKPMYLNNLGLSFVRRFERSGDLADVDNAIRVQREAVDLIPEGHSKKPMYLSNLGNSFSRRFERLGDLVDVDSAIRVRQEAVDLTPEGHADKPGLLDKLGISFSRRFERLGDLADIDSAIRMQCQAIDLTLEGHADKPGCLNNLGISFTCRFERSGDLADVDSAIRVQREAVDLTPEGHSNKPMYLNNLGLSFVCRFERLGDLADVDSAIYVHRETVDLTPEGHADQPRWLNNLGLSFMRRFERLGDLADVDSAIRVQREAVDLIPGGHSKKPMYLSNLGNFFSRRFERLGDLADVDSAIHMQCQAVNLTPEGHADKPGWLHNLGISFMRRFERSGDLADVDSAIRVQREAVDLTPEGHFNKPVYLSNLGNSFSRRFERLGDLVDVDSAIRVQREAVDLTPDGHADKPGYLNNFGISLMRRFERSGDLADVDSAIRVQREAVGLTPEGHSNKPMYLNNLGSSFMCRFERLGEMADLHAAIDVFRKAANDPSGPPSDRFHASRRWALLLSSPHSTSSPLEAYRVVLALVPRVVWLGSSIHRRYEELPAIAEVVSEAVTAAIAAGDVACAFEWLEEGRCVIWGQMLQLRTPLDSLRAVDPGLADDLERTSHALDVAGTSQNLQPSASEKKEGSSSEDEAQRHRRLAEEYERMVEKARTLPGCEDFLRPKRLGQFRAAADSGPVAVVNVVEERCDALILLQTSDTVLHVPLPALKRKDVNTWKDSMLQYLRGSGVRARGSRHPLPAAGEKHSMPSILANLWSNIVQPVLNALTEEGIAGNIPHLTWCATGPLAFLPLHAAGIYDSSAGPKIFDFVVSSYTPTLSALLEAERRGHSRSPTPTILAVSQPGTPGQSALPGTVQEIAAVKKIIGNHGRYLDGEAATRDSVLGAMADHDWIHLACHAYQHPRDPTQSAFLLHNSQLELLSIMQRSFKHTELAFLSACQTATGDEKLTEEAAHLAAGLLMAGYSSVVATMWSIIDKDAPVVAKEFYTRLMEDGGDGRRKAAYALHDAVKLLRDQVGEKEFLRWVPFIHIGI